MAHEYTYIYFFVCELKVSKRNHTPKIWKKQWCRNKHTFWFPILFSRKGTRLLGVITDCRAQIRNIEESGGSYCIKKEVNKKKKKDPHSNGVMSKKKGMNFQWPELEQDEQRNKLSKSSFGVIHKAIQWDLSRQASMIGEHGAVVGQMRWEVKRIPMQTEYPSTRSQNSNRVNR